MVCSRMEKVVSNSQSQKVIISTMSKAVSSLSPAMRANAATAATSTMPRQLLIDSHMPESCFFILERAILWNAIIITHGAKLAVPKSMWTRHFAGKEHVL